MRESNFADPQSAQTIERYLLPHRGHLELGMHKHRGAAQNGGCTEGETPSIDTTDYTTQLNKLQMK